jgi:MOSC domain-containing protein YiiM
MTLHHIYISPAHNYFGHHGHPPGTAEVQDVAEVEAVSGQGLRGDRFFGWKENYKGQVTFFAREVYEELCGMFQLYDYAPSVFRRNLIVSGVPDLNQLIGQEFELQGVLFRGTQESAPCYWMNQAFAPGAEEAMKGRGGLRAQVLTSGILRRTTSEH